MPLFRKKEKKTDVPPQTSTPMKVTKFEITDWRKAVALKNGEYVILQTDWATNQRSREIFERFVKMLNAKGDFVLTNQRLVFLGHKFAEESDGKTVLSFELQREFPLESIKDVTYPPKEVTIYTDEGEYDCGNMGVIRTIDYPTHGEDRPTYFFNYFRKKLIEQKEKKAAVTFDFSFLKHTLEKGGIVLTTLTCPKCNAPLKMPTGGTETTCQHCGSVVYAQDIFKKLKTLLS
jgi:hypothetical protein